MTARTALRRLLGWTGTALALGFVVRATLLGAVDDRGRALALLAAGLLLAFAWLDRDAVGAAARSTAVQARATALLLVGAAAAVGVLAYAVVREVDDTVDLTGRRLRALGTHTEGVLDGLDRDVHVTAAFTATSPLRGEVAALLRRYAERSPRLTVELVDPLAAPLAARRLGVTTEAGEVVLQAGEATERVLARFDEDAVTDALVRLTSPQDHVVCWSTGHGEAEPDDPRSPGGAGAVVSALEGLDTQVLHTDLRAAVDPACEALVVAGPRVDLLPLEQARLVDWVLGGGRALVLLEPGLADGLARALATLGVTVGDDVVLEGDPSRGAPGSDDPSMLLLPPREQPAHPVIAGLRGAVLVRLARSAAPAPAPGLRAAPLLVAGPLSWAERDPLGAEPEPDPGELLGHVPLATVVEVDDPAAVDLSALADTRLDLDALLQRTLRELGLDPTSAGDRSLVELGVTGDALAPLAEVLRLATGVSLAPRAAWTLDELRDGLADGLAERLVDAPPRTPPARRPGGRLVVVGDAGLIGNGATALGSNQDLVLNMVAWLVGEDDQLGERADDLGDDLLLSARDHAAMTLLALGLLPGLALAGGARAWRRRAR